MVQRACLGSEQPAEGTHRKHRSKPAALARFRWRFVGHRRPTGMPKCIVNHLRRGMWTPRGSCNRTLLRRVLRRFFKGSHTPSTAGTFRKKFRKNSGKTPETLSERFLEFPSRVRLGCPKAYNSKAFEASRAFPEFSPPPSTAGDASFFRIGSGEGLSEPVMEFPAVLGVSLIKGSAFLEGFLEGTL